MKKIILIALILSFMGSQKNLWASDQKGDEDNTPFKKLSDRKKNLFEKKEVQKNEIIIPFRDQNLFKAKASFFQDFQTPKEEIEIVKETGVRKTFLQIMKETNCIPNIFTELPPFIFMKILFPCDYKTVEALNCTSKGINMRIDFLSRQINQKQINFIQSCKEEMHKTGDFVQDTQEFIFQMERTILKNPEEYKDTLAPLFQSYCEDEKFIGWYICKRILPPIFMELTQRTENETWESKFREIFDVSLFKGSTSLIMLQFFLNHGVNVDCYVKSNIYGANEFTLLGCLVNNLQAFNYKETVFLNIAQFLLKKGANPQKKMILEQLLKYCKPVSFLTGESFESYAKPYFDLYVLFYKYGAVFEETAKNRKLLKALEAYRKNKD